MLADNGVDVIGAEHIFVSNKVIEVVAGDDQELTAETIVINTGAVSNVLADLGLTTPSMSTIQLVFKPLEALQKI